MNSFFRCLSAGLLLLAFSPTPSFSQAGGDPFSYQSPEPANYESFTSQSLYIRLSDGTRLATDVFLPGESEEKGPFPTVFLFTPYNRSALMPRMGPLLKLGAKLTGFGWGPTFEMPVIFDGVALLLEHGYAVVVSDMRGTGASFGSQLPLMPQIGQDGKEIVDWIAEQSWSDGKVGMMGPSYLAWAQFATANFQPKALRCIMPEVMTFEMYTGANRPGGIPAQRWLENFSARIESFNRNYFDRKEGLLPAVPVLDEDGDGQRKDEWPQIDSLSLAQRKTPVFRDGNSRDSSLYYQATLEHLDNVPIRTFLQPEFQFIDGLGPAPYEDISYRASSPGSFVPAIQASGIAVYHVGGWYDGFVKGTAQLYATLAPSNPSKLWLAPRFHFPEVSKGYQKLGEYEGKYAEQLAKEQLRFFDRYLKGLENGLDTEPPVRYFVMREGWRTSQEWPPEQAQATDFFLSPQHQLQASQGEAGSDPYAVDYAVSSDYGKDDFNRWQMSQRGPKRPMERSEADERCLVYDSPPLEKGISFAGHPLVHLWLSSNQPTADLFVYLSSVSPEGKAYYLTEGQLRANWHPLHPPTEQVLGEVEVRPELPWHGYKEDQWVANPLADGKTIEMVLDLMPTAWHIPAGHRIRISIAGADAGNFSLHPDLCPDQDPANCPATEIRIHRSAAMPSRLVLPILR